MKTIPSGYLLISAGLLAFLWSRAAGVGSDLPRGIRNNNPGNIEANATQWLGKIGDDGRFVVFDTPENGLRALGRVLLTYRNKHGIDTVQGIISRWAPPGENKTGAYIEHVSNKLAVSPNDSLELVDYPPLMAAIITHENGAQPYSAEQIAEGFKRAMV